MTLCSRMGMLSGVASERARRLETKVFFDLSALKKCTRTYSTALFKQHSVGQGAARGNQRLGLC